MRRPTTTAALALAGLLVVTAAAGATKGTKQGDDRGGKPSKTSETSETTATSGDPHRDQQWGLDHLRAERAWAASTGDGVTIAVVDTGVDLDHPDLDSKLVAHAEADFVDDKNREGDGPQDENGHGTHVAGIAAALTGNGIGVAGTAPGAKILPVRVLDESGNGSTDDVAAGIRYAADSGAAVINLSLGLLSGVDKVVKLVGALEPLYEAIDRAVAQGAVVVVAAGNDSVPLCAEPSAHPDVLCVGAVDRERIRSFYSNSDATMTAHYLVAPGGHALTCAGDIFSTYLRSERSYCGPTGYEALAGTSMAAPFVSGVAALLAAQGLTGAEIIQRIEGTATDLGSPGRDPVYGYGEVDAARAVGA